MSKIVALIPARSGSKGVKDKNIRELGGHPLIGWSIAACQKSRLIDRIIVSTDSKEYANLATSLGADVPFIRPAEISLDNSSDISFIQHSIDYFNNNNLNFEYIAHIRPTTPIRDPKLIDEAINLFIKSKGSSLRSVSKMAESAYKYFEINSLGYLKALGNKDSSIDLYNDPRQKFPSTYTPNGYIDVLSIKFIEENGILHGSKVIPFLTPKITEIDDEFDFNYLEYQVSKHPSIINNLFK